jgi:hypothetical protein
MLIVTKGGQGLCQDHESWLTKYADCVICICGIHGEYQLDDFKKCCGTIGLAHEEPHWLLMLSPSCLLCFCLTHLLYLVNSSSKDSLIFTFFFLSTPCAPIEWGFGPAETCLGQVWSTILADLWEYVFYLLLLNLNFYLYLLVFSAPANNRIYKIMWYQFWDGLVNNEHTRVYPDPGSSIEVKELRPAGWYWVKTCVTKGEQNAWMIYVLKGVWISCPSDWRAEVLS